MIDAGARLAQLAAFPRLPTGNPLQSVAQLETEPRISNAVKYPATASTTQWFLMTGPVSAPVYLGALDGQLVPQVELFDKDVGFLGIQFRVFIDVGCVMGHHEAAVKSRGAA